MKGRVIDSKVKPDDTGHRRDSDTGHERGVTQDIGGIKTRLDRIEFIFVIINLFCKIN